MKIYNAEQIRQWDAFTIKNEPITSLALMNRAAHAFADWFLSIYSSNQDQPVYIICGTGNNGGDGLAVARLLHYSFFEAKVLVCHFTKKLSADFEAQISLLPPNEAVSVTWLSAADHLPIIPENALIIDALLGSGLNRAPEGDFAKTIEWMNGQPNETIAIDLPSGLFADQHTPGICVHADRTFSFQTPKLAFLFPENAEKVGQWEIGAIGLHPLYETETPTPFHYFTNKEASALFRLRQKFGHKGTYGHALLLAGSYGKMGAAVLSARACLRSGVGLLTVQVPRCGLEILQISVPEAMCLADEAPQELTTLLDIAKYNAIGIGPGIGTDQQTANLLEQLLATAQNPLVLDADALNLLAKNPDWWAFLPKNSILTPHPKEFERLFGTSLNDFDRNDLQRKMAIQHGVFILLKGAHSAVACPDGECWFNSTGNPGMATGGSGDVLTGMVTALLAQGYPPKDALRLGIYLHGLAGDIAAQKHGAAAMIASDMVESLGEAMLAFG